MEQLIQVEYEQLQAIAGRFAREAEATGQAEQRLRERMAVLRDSWRGTGAAAFFAEMEGEVLPATARLREALAEAQRTTQQVAALMRSAEEEAAALFAATTASSIAIAGTAGEAEGMPPWLSELLEMALLGDFSDKSGFWGLLAQVGIGFVPIVGQIADIRDIIANLRKVADGEEGAWVFLGIAILAIIPGLDALKAAKFMKPIFHALGDKRSREVIEYLFKNPREIARVIRSLKELAANPNVAELLSRHPEGALLLIKHGSPELVSSLSRHGDSAIEVALRYGGNDGAYIATHYDRYLELAPDAAHGGRVDEKSLREAGVSLAMEGRGVLQGPLRNDPTPAAEVIDATGQAWDVKGWNSNYPNGFEINRAMRMIRREIGEGENIIVDAQNMSQAHIDTLREEINRAGLTAHVVWYP